MRLTVLLVLLTLSIQAGELPKVIGGGKVDEVFWLRLDKGDLMLESIRDFVKAHRITDGAVITAVGGLDGCRFHGVGGSMTETFEQVELLSMNGIIADSDPHLHVIVSNKHRGAFGGHLEEGCKVLSQVEITVARFSGAPLTRTAQPGKTKALRKK